MTLRRAKSGQPAPRRKTIEASEIEKGRAVERIIFKPRRRLMTRAALHRALDRVIGEWLTAACAWDDLAIGDHRFVIFSTDVRRDTHVYVQFWSEPMELVLWEVSSGNWNPPADVWLAGERSQRIEAFGFEIGGEAGNFQREVGIGSPADAARIAHEVVDLFYSAFDYRGTTALAAMLGYEGRSEVRPTFEAFTPQDVGKLFSEYGYRVEEAEIERDGEPPMLRCRKRGVSTMVEFGEQVPDENLYGTARLSCELKARPEDLPALSPSQEAAGAGLPMLAVSRFLPFKGGVTLDWVIARLVEWEAMIASRSRRARGRRSLENVSHATVH